MPTAPSPWDPSPGSVPGGGTYPVGAIGRPAIDCPSYASTAAIGPPRGGAGLFSVTHAGWTAPEHGLRPRSPFRLTTDHVRDGRALRMSPEVALPDCAR